MKKPSYILPFMLLLLLVASVSCNKKETGTTTYSEALVTTFSFAADTLYPGLSAASFKIVTSTDTGHIYSKDSLRYGTCLDSVKPKLTFNHAPSYAMIITPNDTVVYSGNDVMNLSQGPIKLYVMASDKEHDKWYNINMAVHQIDPDLYQWERLNTGIFEADGADSRALLHNGQFYLFVNDGMSSKLYTSTDAATWSAPQAITGLPTACAVRQIIADDQFYYADSTGLYTSTDGQTFALASDYAGADFRLVSMLCTFNDSIWAVAERTADSKFVLLNMAQGGTLKATPLVLPSDTCFPVSDFGALTFASAAGRARAMIMGGHNKHGQPLNSRWNMEFLPNRGYALVNFSVEQPSFEALTGISLVWYDHAIHMFGGINKDVEIGTDHQYVSYDEGLHWQLPDTTHNKLPKEYQARQKASVITTADHYIYVIGGQSRTATFSDVWRGRLNRTLYDTYNPN